MIHHEAACCVRFADQDEALARGVAGHAASLQFLLTVPPPRRQPNLLLAAVRQLFGTPQDWPAFRTSSWPIPIPSVR